MFEGKSFLVHALFIDRGKGYHTFSFYYIRR
nr:MAG TPA: hypothetical protein [Bacteriophage sp.]